MFRRKLTAKTHSAMWNNQLELASSANGVSTDGHPRLTNDEVLQLVDYWRLASKKKGQPWDGWYEIAKLGLGFFKEGDKFRIDSAHAKAMFPDRFLNFIWNAPLGFQAIANKLRGTPHPFSPTAKTAARSKRIAKLAYARLQRERSKRRAPTRLPTVVVRPGVPGTEQAFKVKFAKKKKPVPFWVWLLLLAVATSNNR